VSERAAVVPVLVAATEFGVVGTLTYVPGPGPLAELAQTGDAEIRMFAVHPSAQGTGAGSALLDFAIQMATDDRRRSMVLSTSPWMTAAQALYASRGFVREPQLDRFEDSSGVSFELFAYRLTLPR
jgi:ribosomal protein S18 acetylase RimI-like enzyme